MCSNMDVNFPLKFLQDFLSRHPAIKVFQPTDAEWPEVKKCYINQAGAPSVIARPQEASHIQDLVRLCVSNNVDFVIRSGGHDCAGRSQVNGALAVDMRDIQHVNISEDKQTAKIGGGILTGKLTKVLGEQGLVTPT